ncbi:MAG TPA: hypothetical protein VFQ68_32145 [Streptosporangiaceae bacterium]|nr:hypothetical protein [Streptosporangiaceae bacterium]
MIDQTEELLRAGMERFAADADVPPGLAARATRHRQRSKRVRTATAIAAAAAAATAAVTAVIVAIPGPSPRVQTAAYVVSRVQGALTRASSQNAIQYVRETNSAGIYFPDGISGQIVRSWTYRGQSRIAVYTSDGRITGEIGTTAGRQQTMTEVSYERKTWWRESLTGNAPSIAPTPESSCDEATVIMGGGLAAGSNLAADIRAALSCGQYTVAGTQLVNGVKALELRPVKTGNVTAVFWVDPSTYLPVRDLVTAGLGTSRDDFRWLPPTPASLADLDVRIPPGFAQVPPPH